ncbi:hypothetical protein OP10G_2270 [Fimbriimonas ginsengisoli Gsoil 348]|uniref:Peptidase S54 rhomboid domain-containing protein n=1 Tax=Fimbriimonas ginsengisoli Gsoil 348 TaxID=661478 RepID=A0A068NQ16_FIMGI|nr:hypothetical protein OP10G_2270 [Fimbriimonas ginsengisoli Gsoil 348]
MDDFKGWARRQGAPVTVAIIGSLIVVALVLGFAQGRGLESIALYGDWWNRPWTLVTYPWAFMPFQTGMGILGMVFLVMWVMWVGASLEREMGSGRFALFLLAMTVIPGLVLGLASLASKENVLVAQPWLPIEGITVAWCTRNPSAVIHIFGVLPVSGKWLGWLTVVGTFLTLGSTNPMFGVLACVHLALAWAYVSGKLPIRYRGEGVFQVKKKPSHATRAQAQYDESYYDEVRKREKERSERERLRQLLGESQDDEGDEGQGARR